MTHTEKSLTCSDCGKPFPFTAEEQEFFASKSNLKELPGADVRADKTITEYRRSKH